MQNLRLTTLAALAASCFVISAHAQTAAPAKPAAKPAASKTKPAPAPAAAPVPAPPAPPPIPVLTREEYKACLLTNQEIGKIGADLNQLIESVNQLKRDVRSAEVTLTEQRAAIKPEDKNSKAAIDSYNEGVRLQKDRVVKANEGDQQVAAMDAKLNELTEHYDTQCLSKRPPSAKDVEAVKTELGLPLQGK